MLAKKELDIVLVDTPDHWHALPMIAAVESGADVYCQKPTAVDVLESKAMLDAARKHNRVVQIGTQRRSTPHLIEAKQRVIDAGSWATWLTLKSVVIITCAIARPKKTRPIKPHPSI